METTDVNPPDAGEAPVEHHHESGLQIESSTVSPKTGDLPIVPPIRPCSTISIFVSNDVQYGLYDGQLPDSEANRMLYPKAIPGGFLNMSGQSVPLEVEILLSFGPVYSPLQPPNIQDYLVALKKYSDGCLENHVNLGLYCRAELEAHYSRFLDIMMKHQVQTSYHKMLTQLYRITYSFLKKHDTLIIVQADKGKTSILIPRVDYINKVQEWIDTYVKSGSCVVYAGDRGMLVRRLTALYRRIALPLCSQYTQKTVQFPYQIYNELHEKLYDEPELPYLYGHLKVHKPECPIRPICSPVGWYISPLHKMCTYVLQTTLGDRLSKHNLTDMNDLTGHLLDLRPRKGYVLATLDVKEMYPRTQIEPLWETLQNLMKMSWFCEKCPIDMNMLERILDYILRQGNYFTFNSVWYQQVEGLPQGGAASGLLASIYLDSKLEIYNQAIFKANGVGGWWKYVDDILLYIPRSAVEDFMAAFTKWTNYDVTCELEAEHLDYGNKPVLPYLDYCIIHTEEQFLIALYQKPTSSQRLVHYTSHVSAESKHTAVLYHLRRILHRTSDQYLHNDLTKCISQLLINGYPHDYIIGVIHELVVKSSRDISSNIQPYSEFRRNYLMQYSKPCHHNNGQVYPNLLSTISEPRRYLSSIVYSCEEISALLRAALGSLGIPTFSRPETLFHKLGMSLRDVQPSSKVKAKHRILMVTCTTCGIGYICTGKGSSRVIMEDIVRDPSTPISKHLSDTGHSGLDAPVELPCNRQLTNCELVYLYKQVYTSMGVLWDEAKDYEKIPRFLAHGLDSYITRIKTVYPKPMRKHQK